MNQLTKLRQAVQTKDFPVALKLAETLLNRHPKSVEVRRLYSIVLTQTGQPKEALNQLNQARNLAPENVDIEIAIGKLYKALGQNIKARGHLAKAKSLNPRRGEAVYELGKLYQKMGQLKKAEEAFLSARTLTPDDPQVDSRLAALAEAGGRPQEAAELYQTALQKDPNHPEILFNYGRLLRTLGDSAEAVHFFRHALKIKPRWEQAQIHQALCRRELGQTEEEIGCWDDLIHLHPRNPEYKRNKGLAMIRAHRIEEAKELLDTLLTNPPDDRESLTARMMIAEKEENQEDKERFLKRLSSGFPESPDTLFFQARALADSNQLEKASEKLATVPEDYPGRDLLRAEILEASTRWQEAAELRESLFSEPSGEECLRQSELWSQADAPDRALSLLEEALSKNEETPPELLIRKSRLLDRLDRHEEALALLTDLRGRHPDLPEIVESLVKIYSRTNQEEIAAAELSGTSGDDLSALSKSLELYDQVVDQWEENTEARWRDNLERLSRLAEDSAEPEPTFDDEVPILDIGGIEPVIAVMEEEETISLTEMEEDLNLTPEEPEEEDKIRITDEQGETAELPRIPESFQRPDPADLPRDPLHLPEETPRPQTAVGSEEKTPDLSPEPAQSAAASPPEPSSTPVAPTTPGNQNINVSIRAEAPPGDTGADVLSAPPRPLPPVMPISTPSAEPPGLSTGSGPTRVPSSAPLPVEKEEKPQRPRNLLDYLEHLTEHLPEEQKAEFDENLKLKYDLMRMKIEARGGLEKVIHDPELQPKPLPPDQIKKTLSYMGSLADHGRNETLGVAMKKKIEDIVSQLDNHSEESAGAECDE